MHAPDTTSLLGQSVADPLRPCVAPMQRRRREGPGLGRGGVSEGGCAAAATAADDDDDDDSGDGKRTTDGQRV
jgi:hypothetical protein